MREISEPSANGKAGAARISVFSNSALVLTKLAVGIITGSVSIISEAAHSAVDLLAALIAYYAVTTSDKEPDRNHAYGHGKVENISGAVEAVLIIVAAIWIIYEAGHKFSSQELPKDLEYGIAIMAISIVVNYFVSRRLFLVARRTQSQALEADALHLESDIWTSIGVLVGLVAIKATGLYWLDPVIAIVVAAIIFRAGFGMTRKSMRGAYRRGAACRGAVKNPGNNRKAPNGQGISPPADPAFRQQATGGRSYLAVRRPDPGRIACGLQRDRNPHQVGLFALRRGNPPGAVRRFRTAIMNPSYRIII